MALVSQQQNLHCYFRESKVDSDQKRLGMVALDHDICPGFIHVTAEIRSDSGDMVKKDLQFKEFRNPTPW